MIITAGCSKNLPAPDSAGAAPAMTHTGAPLTEDDGKVFGEKLEQAVAAGDIAAVSKLFPVVDIIERSVSDFGLTTSMRKGLLAGAASSTSKFPELLSKVIEEGGSYSLLRVRTVAGRPQVIMRLLHGEGAANYHEFTLVRYPNQQIAAEDVYFYASGEPLSHTTRRLLLGLWAEQKSGIASLSREEQELSKHFGDIQRMSAMIQDGQNDEALEIFRKLPAELQRNKFFQLLAIQAAQGTDDDKNYISELERFRKNYPRDAAGDLISIDYFLLKKEYDQALSAITRLDNTLGGDPYLEAMRAGVLSEAGRFIEARVAAEKAIKGDPHLPQAYWSWATVAAAQKDHDDTLRCLKIIVEKIDPTLDPDALATDERFVEFATTSQFDEFKRWLAKRVE